MSENDFLDAVERYRRKRRALGIQVLFVTTESSEDFRRALESVAEHPCPRAALIVHDPATKQSLCRRKGEKGWEEA